MKHLNQIPPDIVFRYLVHHACKEKLNCLGKPIGYNCRIWWRETPDGFCTTLEYDSHQVNLCIGDVYKYFLVPKGTKAYYAIKCGKKQKHLNPWTSNGYAYIHLNTLYERNRKSISTIYGYVVQKIFDAWKHGKPVSLWNGVATKLDLKPCSCDELKIAFDLGLANINDIPWYQWS